MGAFGFSGDDGNSMPLRMDKSCQVKEVGPDGAEFFKNDYCTPWSRTGTSLKAYQSDVDEAFVDFDLIYPVYFDEEGSVEFKYRKDTIGTQDSAYGIFKFLIDDYPQLTDDRIDNTGWETHSVDQIP